MVLANHEPKRVFHHFEAISQIPRGSGNEKAVSDFVAAWAKDLGLKVVQDELHNLIIYKPGTAGYENAPPLILQGHLDMVCEKNADTDHDFLKDPIKLYVDGDFIKAKGTTLGADNGIAIALCMAILEADDIPHPPLEAVFTSDEEAGMTGAMHIDPALLKGRRMCNLDSGSVGTYTAGSAAASTVHFDVQAQWEDSADWDGLMITVKGLHGGHSGGDIKKERGNAIRILGQVLNEIDKVTEVCIGEANGGMKVNAIPREAYAKVAVKDKALAKAAVEKYFAVLKGFYRVADPGLVVEVVDIDCPEVVTARYETKSIIAAILLLPYGVQMMSRDVEGLVAASCNLGVLETFTDYTKDRIRISCMARGASAEHITMVEDKVYALAHIFGMEELEFSHRSPAWAFNPESKILKAFTAYHEKMYGEVPHVTAMHGGLECGIFAEKLPGLDIVACGPNMYDLHTPEERLSISSTQAFWGFLRGVLGEIR